MLIIFSYRLLLKTFLLLTVLFTTTNITTHAQDFNYLLNYDKNFIISNHTFTSYRDFPDEGKVQEYLDKRESVLRSYKDPTSNLTASQIIFRASTGELTPKEGVTTKLSPALMLTMLEKEQSLISTKIYDTEKDPAKKMTSAMGYACYDGQPCKPEYKGFYNQVLWGAYQLKYNFENAKNPKFLPHNVNSVFNTQYKYNVKIENEATASLYRYTPYAYIGNYNVFKIMNVNGWTINKIDTTTDYVDKVNSRNQSELNCDEVFKLKYSLNEKSKRVENLQKCLLKENLFNYTTITGYLGNITKDGLIKYYTKINSCNKFLYKNFRIGTRNQEIHNLQKCLIDNKLFPLNYTTGYYGPITNAMLKKFKD